MTLVKSDIFDTGFYHLDEYIEGYLIVIKRVEYGDNGNAETNFLINHIRAY